MKENFKKLSGDYRKAYEFTYWGNNITDDCDLMNEIFKNRMDLFDQYGLKYVPQMSRPKYISMFIYNLRLNKNINVDHLELYKTKDKKYLLVNSPYCPSDKDEKELLEFGFQTYPNLYAYLAKSYIYEFKNRKDIPKSFL